MQMIALKQCGRHAPGSLFSAQGPHALALIALGRAEYDTKVLTAGDYPAGYPTKAGGPPNCSNPAEKRGRGRPRVRPLIG